MSSLLLTNFLDIARSLGSQPEKATPESVAHFIKKELGPGGGLFNYNTSINSLAALFKGDLCVEDAEDYCLRHGAPAGRKQNADAIRLAGSYAAGEKSNCYKIPFSAVPVGRLSGNRTVYMAIKAPLVRVRNGSVFVVVPGFRLGHRPQGAEIDVAASFALANFGRDDFDAADYEYMDCSRGSSGERELQIYRGKDRRIYSLDEVDNFLGIYVRGLAIAVDGGMEARAPNFRGYRVIDPDQPRMI